MQEQKHQPVSKSQVVWVAGYLNTNVWHRATTTACHTDDETGNCSSQVSTKTVDDHLEKDKVRNENIKKKTRLQKLEHIINKGWEWRTPEYLTRQYSGNWDATKEPGWPRKNWVDEIWKTWTLPGKKPKNWQQTEQKGINMWPNAFTRMQSEQRLRSILFYYAAILTFLNLPVHLSHTGI